MVTTPSSLALSDLSADLRNGIKKIIKHELYSRDEFPREHFPDIDSILFDLFVKIVKSKEDLWLHLKEHQSFQDVKPLLCQHLKFSNLLKNYPQAVVMIYKRYIEKFILYKHSNPMDREDIIQEVFTRLIEYKIYKIKEKFSFNLHNSKKNCSFTSYLMVTVRNIYIDIIRAQRIRPLTSGEIRELDDVEDFLADKKMFNRLMMKEEFIKLRTIFLMFYKTRPKLEICIKLKYRIRISAEEVKKYIPNCEKKDLKILTQDYKFMKDKQLFEEIFSVFNLYEKKQNKSDSLRKWINVKIDEIIAHMNRTHRFDVYNNKNFADFITLYYQNTNDSKMSA
jgi:hypothetical protein